MGKAMQQLVELSHSGFPVTIYYAFKQSDTKGDGTSIHGLGNLFGSSIQSGVFTQWHLAIENRANGGNENRHQCTCLQYRPRLPLTCRGCTNDFPSRVFARVDRRFTGSTRRNDQRRWRRIFACGTSGFVASHHWPRHGSVFQIRRRA